MELTVTFEGSSSVALQLQDDLASIRDEQPDVAEVNVVDSDAEPSRIAGAETVLIVGLVYGVPLAALHVVDLFYKVRQRLRPMAVLDLTTDEPTFTVIEGANGHRGELVIKTEAGEEATFHDGPDVPRDALQQFVDRFLPT